MTIPRTLALATATLILAGCGGSSSSHVCNVRPSANGKTLIYSPPGCQHHLNGETLNIQTNP